MFIFFLIMILIIIVVDAVVGFINVLQTSIHQPQRLIMGALSCIRYDFCKIV